MGDYSTKRNGRLQKQCQSGPPRPVRRTAQPIQPAECCYPKPVECYYSKPARCFPMYESCYPREPCQVVCGDSRCSYPSKTDSGFLHNLRNGFQKMFNAKKKPCEPLSCGRVYNYSTSQLKYMAQCLDKLEEETCCIEATIKEALNNNCRMDCSALRCSVVTVAEQVDGMKCDLMCAYECYDPYRDRCEYEMICNLLDRTQALDGCLSDLCLQLECMESYSLYPGPCMVNCQKPCCVRRPPCRPNCKKPCCYQPCTMPCEPCAVPCVDPCDPYCNPCSPRPYCSLPCDDRCNPCSVKPGCAVDCRKPCCTKPRRWRNGYSRCPKPLCRTSSVIPVGVMLVKL
uniref:Uncharacterized protein n=1 Tax=Graphocephala atropunctata TaxID=36148 RepID=A0A1B6KUC2_9HEMI